MKTEESSSSLSSTEVLSPLSFICTSSVKKEENEKELEGDDGNKDDDDEENHQWIEFFESNTKTNNLDDKNEGNDDDDDDGRNEGATAGRSSSSITIKTEEEEVPDSIPSKSSMIEMEEEEEVDEDVFTSIINNTLVWGDGTITGGVTACEGKQQVKKEGKNKEEEKATEKEDDNAYDKGYASWADRIYPNTNDSFPTAASTNHCVRRKFNSNNNNDYDDVDDNVDDERKPPPKKKIRVLAVAEEDINCEADEDHTDNDDDDDDDSNCTSSKTITTETKYNKGQIEFWHKMFRRFVAYKEQHVNINNPQRLNEDPQLGCWVNTQQKFYNQNMISKYRVDLLNSIGFVWDLCDAKWMKIYQRLIVYKKQHKTTSVPQFYKEDRSLANWVNKQRQCYKNKTLSIERINYLESIGFVWKVHASWIEMYGRLVAYKQCHQSTLVPYRYTEDSSLGVWVYTQRGSYNKDKLSEKRTELLNSIDFVWWAR